MALVTTLPKSSLATLLGITTAEVETITDIELYPANSNIHPGANRAVNLMRVSFTTNTVITDPTTGNVLRRRKLSNSKDIVLT